MSRPRSLIAAVMATATALATLGVAATGAAAADLPVVDDFTAPLASGTAGTVPLGFFQAQDPQSTVSFSRTTDLPAPVPGSEPGNAALRTDMTVASFGVVVRTFEDTSATQWVSQDWSAFEGFELTVHGEGTGTSLFVDIIDNRGPGSTTDDGERWSASFTDDVAGWRTVRLPFDSMTRKDVGNGAPNDGFGLTEVWGWAFGALATGGQARTWFVDDVGVYGTAPERPLTVGFGRADNPVTEGETASVPVRLSKPSAEPVSVRWATTTGTARPGLDYPRSSGTVTFAPNQTLATLDVPTIGDTKYTGERGVVVQLSQPVGAELGRPPLTRVNILDDEAYDPTLVEDAETPPYLWDAGERTRVTNRLVRAGDPLAVPGQGDVEHVLSLSRTGGDDAVRARRPFAQPQDWSDSAGLQMWYYGRGTGKPVTVGLENGRTRPADADPSTWKLAWSDEFSGRKGTSPNPANWTPEIGDGTIIGKPGWGNDELQYYTDSTRNAVLDGKGRLVLTTRKEDPASAPTCYYGACTYTSARLVTQNKQEFHTGRIEARVKVPRGQGLWPAFWSLGTDINRNPWPAAGEIDVMEVVGRLPKQVYGTIHGPGYSGGQSFGNAIDLEEDVADAFHTFSVEWSPEKVTWFVDGLQYHEATPADVAPNEWVFDKPFFLLLNTAVGGNFGGPVGADATFPQAMTVDYVRVFQPAERPARFAASFKDSFRGWKQVSIPFSQFRGGSGGALDLTAVRALTISAEPARKSPVLLDQVRLACAPTTTVTTAAADGPGSLRRALGSACAGGTVGFDPALAGQTLTVPGEVVLGKDVTLDASAAPGVALSGGGTVRPLVVSSGVTATVRGLTIRDGYGFELAGGVLNNGSLTLDGVRVSGNRVATSGNDFWKGGGGVYTGENGRLVLRDSTVEGNSVEGGPGGGVYGFFGSDLLLERTTVSGNTASDVGGGLRTLGTSVLRDSTVSGNTSVGWHGGGMFVTDGTMTVEGTSVTGNTSPDGTAGGAFVGTFGTSSATLTFAGSTVTGNTGPQCFRAPFGAGAVTLSDLGGNTFGDASCAG